VVCFTDLCGINALGGRRVNITQVKQKKEKLWVIDLNEQRIQNSLIVGLQNGDYDD
jgi:hypothetical protein